MNVPARALLLLVVAGALWTGDRLLISPSRKLHAAPLHHAPLAPAPVSNIAIDTPFGPMPPPGAPSAVPWSGFDSSGTPWSFPGFNCWESVNAYTCGDPDCFQYSAWPSETLPNPDDPRAWDRLESSLHPGDVVEFIAHIHLLNGTISNTVYHVHLCIAPGGLMGGANNEPAFAPSYGVPYYTNRWFTCTSRAYYAALRAAEPDWSAIGYPRTYTVVVFHHPWWCDELSAK